MKGELPFASPCVVGHEITGEVVEHGPATDTKTIARCTLFRFQQSSSSSVNNALIRLSIERNFESGVHKSQL